MPCRSRGDAYTRGGRKEEGGICIFPVTTCLASHRVPSFLPLYLFKFIPRVADNVEKKPREKGV